ncbi:hypothetical protein AB9K32_03810 [Allomuricauda sp. XS_ASV26]|jgi:hypothetical protein
MVRNKIIGDAKQMSKNETEKSINLLKKLAYIFQEINGENCV